MLKRSGRGFTLIELMIVVAIIAILAAIAVPSYQRYVLRTHRTDAMSALQGLAQAMERSYVQQQPNTYNATVQADGTTPAIFSPTSPIDGGTPRYNLRITLPTPTTYTLDAIPVGAQAGDGTLRLTSTGVKSWDINGDNSFSARWSDSH